MRDIAFVFDRSHSAIALAAIMAFETANVVADEPLYALHYLSETGGPIKATSGLMVETEPFTDMPFDTLVMYGGLNPEPATPGLLVFSREAYKRHRRIAGICSGVFVLAEAGLLDGRRATTHWLHALEFLSRFPQVRHEPRRIFMNDGPIWSSAGGVATLDFCLTLIDHDHGSELAKAISRALVVYHRRAGGEPQHSTLLELAPKSDRIQMALSYARDNLHKPLTVPELAEAACLSPRQFSRAFQAETGQSPAKAIERLRVEGARTLMEHSRHPIEIVARQTGFTDRDQMRRAFLRAFGEPPQVLRRVARLQTGAFVESSGVTG